MKPSAALSEIHSLIRAGLYVFPRHCIDGMRAHGIRTSTALNVILDARSCSAEPSERWRFEGRDHSDRPIRIVVEIAGNVVFVTVHLILRE